MTFHRSEKSTERKTTRCAIYTRKSTEEGLDQEFNSLDAQREACESFIKSQRHEGWLCIPGSYDDGGFSGGDLERPALRRLIEDIEAGKIDIVVVYKVDRLSRSLKDFYQLHEAFEKYGVSFVSVTQRFYTGDALGKLFLNILMSFAQFERDNTRERTRDKMSAARRKGRWTGGIPVLGYDIDPGGGKIHVNAEEAERVREIFELYLGFRSSIKTVRELQRRGWRLKQWTTKKGTTAGGRPFNKATLLNMLGNPIYIGKVRHRGTVHEGLHEAIVDEELFRKVQQAIHKNRLSFGTAGGNKHGALLKGLLRCGRGSRMYFTYTVRNKQIRYPYYVCVQSQKRGCTCPLKRVPARSMEQFVIDHIRQIGSDPSVVSAALQETALQQEEAVISLKKDCQRLSRECLKLEREIQKAVGTGQDQDPELLALTEQMKAKKVELTQHREALKDLERETVSEDEIRDALGQFDPVWDAMLPKEQARVIHLILHQVQFDGQSSSVAFDYRPSGIKSLLQQGGQA